MARLCSACRLRGPLLVGRRVVVVWSFAYMALRRVLGLLALRGRSQRAKDLEIIVLRHELQILRR